MTLVKTKNFYVTDFLKEMYLKTFLLSMWLCISHCVYLCIVVLILMLFEKKIAIDFYVMIMVPVCV